MLVRFWGTRGSIAKPGLSTVRYGGNTSCVELRSSGGTLVLLDCGTGAHGLGQALVKGGPSPLDGHILIGHTHRPGVWQRLDGAVVINTGSFSRPFGGCVAAKRTASATASACNIAERGENPGRVSASTSSHNEVSTAPGDTSVARTPVPTSSARRTAWSPRRPNLLAA